MITKKTALKEAGRFATALAGPLGPRPMQRVVSEFLSFFQEMRASSASWSQIAALIAAAGVRSGSGQPLSDGVLRAMVSRSAREESNKPDASIGAVVKPRTNSSLGTKSGRLAPAATNSPVPSQRRLDLPATSGTVAERIRRAAELRR